MEVLEPNLRKLKAEIEEIIRTRGHEEITVPVAAFLAPVRGMIRQYESLSRAYLELVRENSFLRGEGRRSTRAPGTGEL